MALRPRRIVVGTATAVLTIAMSLVAPPQAALAAPVLDQQQATIDTAAGTVLVIGGSSTQKLAQTVTAGMSGDLVRVDLPVLCASSVDLIVEIRDVLSGGAPGSAIKSTTTIAGSTLPSFGSGAVTFRALTLATSVALTAGSKYTIVLNSTSTDSSAVCSIYPGPVGQSYAGGDMYFDALPNASGWIRNCDFANAPCDLPFNTWVEPPTGADLSIAKTLFNPSNLNVFSGTEQFYQLTVSNAGPSTATGVTIVDTLPANVTLVQAHPACVNSGGILTCTLGPGLANLAAGGSFSIFIEVKFNNAGSYTNTASVSANEMDPNTANNSSSHTQQVLPSADLIISNASYSSVIVDPGDTVTYNTAIENLGPDPTGDVVLIQKIPGNTTFASISSPHTLICGPGANAGEYGCKFSSIPVGGTRSMLVTVTAPGTPQALNSTFSTTHIVPPLILDPVSTNSAAANVVWVVAESIQQTATGGTTTTTDTENDGATVNDPVETSVTSPSAGTVSIVEREWTGTAATAWQVGPEVVISAPPGTASDPIILTFRVDSSMVALWNGAQVDVFRNYASTPVPNCTQPVHPATPSSTVPISPDPCVWKRTTLSDGDVEVVVFTSQASAWGVATHRPFDFGGFEPPMGKPRKAGSTLPIKFRLFNEGGQLVTPAEVADVLVSGSPSSRAVSCQTGEPVADQEAVTVVGGGLHFDADTGAYSINWKTDKSWAGTCRELSLQLIDGSEHTALLRFE